MTSADHFKQYGSERLVRRFTGKNYHAVMKSLLLAITLISTSVQAIWAQDAAPRFPKIGSKYTYSLPHNDGLAPPNLSSNEILFEKWLGGTWYQVAHASPTDLKTHSTSINISQLLTLTEKPKSEQSISQQYNGEKSTKRTRAITAVQARLIGSWKLDFTDVAGFQWSIATNYKSDGTFYSDAIPALTGSGQGFRSNGKWLLKDNQLITVIEDSSEKTLVGVKSIVTVQQLSASTFSYASQDGKRFVETRSN